MVKVGNYDLKEEIGRGTFSKVRLARRISTNEQFVAKIVSRSQQNVDLDVRKEIGILRRVQHENIVKLIEILESPNNYYIILEPVLGGDLCDYIINRHSRGLPVEEVQRLYSQLISGVAMCHGVGVAHRDLKPENLLMTKDEKPVLKISDFGLSRFHRHSQHFAQPHEYAQTVTGTLAYLAPEVLNGHYDAFKADMWSLGCILFVMCTGRFPFGSATGPQLERRILEAAYDPIPEYVDPMAVDVIKRLLQLNPDARMTLPELAAHPFLMSKNQQEQYTLVEDDLATSFASPIRELYTTPIGPNPGLSESSPNPSPHMSPSHGVRREMVRNRMAELARESDGDEEPGAVSQEAPKLSQVPQVPPPS